jgi:hypothetical protein
MKSQKFVCCITESLLTKYVWTTDFTHIMGKIQPTNDKFHTKCVCFYHNYLKGVDFSFSKCRSDPWGSILTLNDLWLAIFVHLKFWGNFKGLVVILNWSKANLTTPFVVWFSIFPTLNSIEFHGRSIQVKLKKGLRLSTLAPNLSSISPSVSTISGVIFLP